MIKQSQKSQRSLYSDKSHDSNYQSSNDRLHMPIFNNTSPYQQHLAQNPLKGLNPRPNHFPPKNPKSLIKPLNKSIASKSLNISPRRQMENKQVKANYRYQPKGIVRKVDTRREYKSIEHPVIKNKQIQNKKRQVSINKKRVSSFVERQERQEKQERQQEEIAPIMMRKMNNPHPEIEQSLCMKSKLQQSYINLFSIYEQAIKRLAVSEFSIIMLDKIEQIRKSCDSYTRKVINIRDQDSEINLFQSSEQIIKQYFKNYKPEWKQFNLQKLISQQSITLKKYKSSIYFGNFKDGKKQGMGIMIYQNGKLFEGTFENDMRVYGMERDQSTNSYYIGRFVNGVKQGGNGFYTDNVTVEYGKFIFDKWVGQGFKLTKQQLICTQGNAISIVKYNDNIFVGKYIDSVKSQICLQRFQDGDIYLGTYEDNKPEGYGEYYWANGAVYQGDFVYGLRHGNGYWFIQNGDEYIGEYSNDKKCGKGQYTWKNGTKYIGEFENDFRHGYGEMFWNTGRNYKGRWVNGLEATKTISLENGEMSEEYQRAPTNTHINVYVGKSKSRSGGKLPQLKSKQQIFRNKVKVDNKFDIKKKVETIDVPVNRSKDMGKDGMRGSKQISQRIIRKDRIKALFNPNFYLEN